MHSWLPCLYGTFFVCTAALAAPARRTQTVRTIRERNMLSPFQRFAHGAKASCGQNKRPAADGNGTDASQKPGFFKKPGFSWPSPRGGIKVERRPRAKYREGVHSR